MLENDDCSVKCLLKDDAPPHPPNSHPLLLFSEEGRGWGLTTVLKTGLTSLKLPMVSTCDFHCSEVEISSAIIVNDLCGVKDLSLIHI